MENKTEENDKIKLSHPTKFYAHVFKDEVCTVNYDSVLYFIALQRWEVEIELINLTPTIPVDKVITTIVAINLQRSNF